MREYAVAFRYKNRLTDMISFQANDETDALRRFKEWANQFRHIDDIEFVAVAEFKEFV